MPHDKSKKHLHDIVDIQVDQPEPKEPLPAEMKFDANAKYIVRDTLVQLNPGGQYVEAETRARDAIVSASDFSNQEWFERLVLTGALVPVESENKEQPE